MSSVQDSFKLHPRTSYTMNCQGRLLDLSKGIIMGILNVSPDSFYDGGKFIEENSILEKAEELISGGAQIIDIGGASSRPGAEFITAEAEKKRIIPVIRSVSRKFPDIIISVDTWRSELASEAIRNGAHIINDISGGDLDPEMFKTVARLKVPYILMHMKGIPKSMQEEPVYEDLITEIIQYFQVRIVQLRTLGVQDIVIDPGFGFGKNLADNYRLLARIEDFNILECPILAGFSRKSMINKILGTTPDTALNGTSILNTIALMKGVQLLRVHDTKEASECIKITNTLKMQQYA